MSKRVADKEINQDNWDDNEEAEEAGSFKQAPEEVLKTRVIKTAKRRNNTATESASTNSIFSGFSFSAKKPDQESPSSTPFFNLAGNNFKPASPAENSKQDVEEEKKSTRDSKFFAEIRSLNESVTRWIKEHVDKDPFCLLTPIFNDYENHLKTIQESYEERTESKDVTSSESSAESTPERTSPSNDCSKNIFSMSTFQSKPQEKNNMPLTFSTGSTFKPITEEAKPKSIFGSGAATFSFGNNSTSASSSLSTAGFSFGTGKPITFGNVTSSAPNTDSTSQVNNEQDEDEPPKAEFKAVVEEDSIYTVRCKVFVKKGEDYVDGGVGNLFLKPIKDKNKTQLIVRADTNLGNLLLNVLLSDSVPTKRMGKNNVMMVCIPTPDKKEPSSILLRVKTSEQADELLEMIEKCKA
uniref:Putative nuclear pore complex component n=1 Tax=Xenopsylla cheopis TaxID=163159 RepID=A0A6M2DFM7_XENCH